MPEIVLSRLPLCPARRRGVVLLMVLLMVMVITVVAMGFMARADSELSCGLNMSLRLQMDQLAQSGLEHAKGLAVRPPYELQGCSSFSLIEQQLIVAQSSDFYDVSVVRDTSDYCTYDITSEGYRRKGTERIGMSRLSAQLRLDPCIALWTGANLAPRPGWFCRGDLYSAGSVDNSGTINGDVFAGAFLGIGTKTGQLNPQTLSLAWPAVTAAYFEPEYTVSPISPGTLPNSTMLTSPLHIWRCDGDLTIGHNTRIEGGMLLVTGNLTITGAGSRIIAGKNIPELSTSIIGNVPALYTGGNLVFRGASNVQICGLAVVDGNVLVGADSANLTVTGALFAQQKIAETAVDSSGWGNDAILNGQPLRVAGNNNGGALDFDGVDDYLQTLNSATALQLWDQYTLSLWVRPDAVQKSWAGLLCKAAASGTPPANHWVLQLDQSATRLVVGHGIGAGASWDTGISLTQMADGDWHHVAIVRQVDGIMVSYFDSIPSKTLDPADPNQTAFQSQPPRNGDGHLNIGADRTASSDYLYHGLLDDIRIYDGALGPADISKLYSMKAVTAIPLGYWPLDEAGSSITVTADAAAAAIVIGPPENNDYWSPAAGGFFRSIRRE